MLEEIRNHDPKPTAEERAWIDSNPIAAAVNIVVVAVIAVALGGYVSLYLEPAPAAVARAGK